MMYEDWAINEEFDDLSKAISHFGDQGSCMEWKMQRYIRKLVETPPQVQLQQDLSDADKLKSPTPTKQLPSVDEIVKMFAWTDSTTSETMYPRRAVAEECLSYDRASNPAWEKLLRITKKTQAGLNERAVKAVLSPYEALKKARASGMKKQRRENKRLEALGQPKNAYIIPPHVPKQKTNDDRPIVKQSTDPTIWTD